MPWHVPEDLQHFKEVTSGKPVIMGRRTWESLPDAYKPLPGRVNIIVSRSVGAVEARGGGIWVSSLDAALEVAHKAQEATSADSLADAWIIGGGTLYAEALTREDLPHYKRVRVVEQTKLATSDLVEVPGDTKAPNLHLYDWAIAMNQQLPDISEHGYLLDGNGGRHQALYLFVTYTRK
jgi:dihydrofolate reductase